MELLLAGLLAIVSVVLILTMLQLRATDRRHRTLLDHIPQTTITVFDHDLRVRFAGGALLSAVSGSLSP